MHVNIYAEDVESGVKGVKVSVETDLYQYVEVEFNNGSAVAFFSKDLRALNMLLAKMASAVEHEELMRIDE